MSSRQLRKLQRQKELEQAQQATTADSAENSAEEEDSVPAAKGRVSLFAALGGDDEDNGGDDGNEDENDEDTEQQDVEPVAQPSSSKSKKKAKKKKKKKAAAAATEPVVDDNDSEEDEIDKAIKDLNLKPGNNVGAGEQTETANAHNDLFKINPYHLRAINEMTNLFGRETISMANNEEDQGQNQRRQHGQALEMDLESFLREPPGAPKLPEVSLRRNIFVQGREHWPRQAAMGLSMNHVLHAEGSWYNYLYGGAYGELHSHFIQCVHMGDPQAMVHLLKRFPYHISTLIQVSMIAKHDGNMSLAFELCERALFTFGRVTTSSFRRDMEQGLARLSYNRFENRQFWLVGYHYIKMLIRKGTYRTALEWVKLLLSLHPTDWYAMRLYAHFLAIRAHEPQWLIDFIQHLDNTSKDPNITKYIRQTVVLAKLQLKDEQGAREDLEAGMRLVPWLYCALFKELGLDAPQSIWGIEADSPMRVYWVTFYLYQAKELWNNPQAHALLQDVAKSLDRIDVSPALPGREPFVSTGSDRLFWLEGDPSLLRLIPESSNQYEFDPNPPEGDAYAASVGVLPEPKEEDAWMPRSVPHSSDWPADEYEIPNPPDAAPNQENNGAFATALQTANESLERFREMTANGVPASAYDLQLLARFRDLARGLSPAVQDQFRAWISSHGQADSMLDPWASDNGGGGDGSGGSGGGGGAGAATVGGGGSNVPPGAWPEEDDEMEEERGGRT